MTDKRTAHVFRAGLLAAAMAAAAATQAAAEPLVFVADGADYSLALRQFTPGSKTILNEIFIFDGVDEAIMLRNDVPAVVSESEIDLGDGRSLLTIEVLGESEIFDDPDLLELVYALGHRNALEMITPVEAVEGTLSLLDQNGEPFTVWPLPIFEPAPWNGSAPDFGILNSASDPGGSYGVRWSITLQPSDSDGDGVPDTEDICPDGDDSLDIDADGIPDACDMLCEADVVPDGVFNHDDFQFMDSQLGSGADPLHFDLDHSGTFDFLDWLELLNGCE